MISFWICIKFNDLTIRCFNNKEKNNLFILPTLNNIIRAINNTKIKMN